MQAIFSSFILLLDPWYLFILNQVKNRIIFRTLAFRRYLSLLNIVA